VISLWVIAAAAALVARGPRFAETFRPPPGKFPDFVQEWVSARNFWAGEPVYQPQRAAVLKHTGYDYPEFDEMMRWNAHPPVAVLATLPFGLIADYPTAHLVWNLCTFALFLLGVWLVLRELSPTVAGVCDPGSDKPASQRPATETKGLRATRLCGWQAVFPVVTVLLCADPVLSQLFQGQLNFLIGFLLMAGWVADRRGYQTLAGVTVGAAAALKLFPGFLVLYFLAARRWRAAGVLVAVAAGLNLVALAAFGMGAFTTYIREVLPSLEVFRGSWSNVSAAGFCRRVANSLGVPGLGPIAGGVCQLAVAAVVVRAAWRARSAAERGRAYCLAVVGMLLASPVAWGHYFVLLVLPFLLLWWRLPAGSPRTVFLALLVVFCLPLRSFANWAMGVAAAGQLQNHLPAPADVGLSLGAFGAFTYALAALFVLLAAAPLEPTPSEPEA
jgi:hypothetical protein